MDHHIMEIQNLDDHKNPNVDTSRPFRSVKEAVEIFGEKFLVKEVYSPKPFNFPNQETPCYYTPSSPHNKSSSHHDHSESGSFFDHSNIDLKMAESLKKLEFELEETKMELRLLKERESETEVALASLNAELHKNMSKLTAKAESDASANAALVSRSMSGLKWEKSSTTLAHILSDGKEENVEEKLSLFEEKLKKKDVKKVMKKKKPLIPLVGDLFWKKKGPSNTVQNPLFASHLSLNS